jgi:hypothetical protein
VKKGIHIHRIYLPKLKFIGFMLFLLKAVLALNKIDPQTVHIQGVYSMGCAAFLVTIPLALARGFYRFDEQTLAHV